jgi:hypothetical protein
MGILLLFATAPGAFAQSLPDGPNKKLVELVCSKCHTTERIARKRLTKAEWAEEVTEMLQEETDVNEEEKDEIIDYLYKNFPAKADANKAEAKETEVALGISGVVSKYSEPLTRVQFERFVWGPRRHFVTIHSALQKTAHLLKPMRSRSIAIHSARWPHSFYGC